MRILYAEDEMPLARAVSHILEKNHYAVDTVHDGREALSYLENGDYDLAVLDVMMPGLDGVAVVQQLRAAGSIIPVILLTAKSEIDDKVLGLDSGANDYMTKPFDAKELLARIRVLTRGIRQADSRLTFGNVTLDQAAFTLTAPGGSYRLANKEFQMMEILMSQPGRLVSAERLLEKIWGYETESEISVVRVYISYLRKKLTALQADIQIKSCRNAGYTLEELP